MWEHTTNKDLERDLMLISIMKDVVKRINNDDDRDSIQKALYKSYDNIQSRLERDKEYGY